MKIGALQLNLIVGDLAGNSEKILTAAKQAAQNGAELIVTSELALTGYPPQDLLLYRRFVSNTQKAAQALAKKAKGLPPLLLGTVVLNTSAGKPLYNAAILIQNGTITNTYYKTLLPTYDVFDEDRYFQPATTPQIATIGKTRVGVSICEDLWHNGDTWTLRRYPHDPIRQLCLHGVDLVVNLSSSPFYVDKQNVRERILARASKAYGVPFVYVNQVGANDELVFDGMSSVFVHGKPIARAAGFAQDVLVVDVAAQPQQLTSIPSQTEQLYHALTTGIRDYARKTGFSSAIIGLSGGIDSAITAALTVQALGNKNVVGLLMPSPFTSDISLAAAQKLAENVNIQTHTVAIEPLMHAYQTALQRLFRGTKPDTTEENIQARIRGQLLMALSNKFGYLVIATGNKSELAVGYVTLYGDLTGGFAPLVDVYKTQVYELARFINNQKHLIPIETMNRPPSAELRAHQTDQDTLPPYDLLDAILTQYIEQHLSAAQITANGFDSHTVHNTINRVQNAEFKRRQAPTGLKVSRQAFGTGWRMPIARK